jgi:hypothetical protein
LKIKYIVGMLICLIITTGIASADSLGTSNYPVALNDVSVGATPSGQTVTFTVNPVSGSGVTSAWLKDVGLPTGTSITGVTDGNGNSISHTVTDNQQMSQFGQFEKVAIGGSVKTSTVIVTFSGTLTNTFFCAHAAWTPWISGQYESDGVTQLTSAFFGSGGGTSIPEFPTVALPVAAVLGLMFILQRRKEN